jgi:hypothetical protein
VPKLSEMPHIHECLFRFTGSHRLLKRQFLEFARQHFACLRSARYECLFRCIGNRRLLEAVKGDGV